MRLIRKWYAIKNGYNNIKYINKQENQFLLLSISFGDQWWKMKIFSRWRKYGKFKWESLKIIDYKWKVERMVRSDAKTEPVLGNSLKLSRNLTDKDHIVLWTGIYDVGRNQSNDCIRALTCTPQKLEHNKVLIMAIPYRYDLSSSSCVTREVKKTNRKIKKCIKGLPKFRYLELPSGARTLYEA